MPRRVRPVNRNFGFRCSVAYVVLLESRSMLAGGRGGDHDDDLGWRFVGKKRPFHHCTVVVSGSDPIPKTRNSTNMNPRNGEPSFRGQQPSDQPEEEPPPLSERVTSTTATSPSRSLPVQPQRQQAATTTTRPTTKQDRQGRRRQRTKSPLVPSFPTNSPPRRSRPPPRPHEQPQPEGRGDPHQRHHTDSTKIRRDQPKATAPPSVGAASIETPPPLSRRRSIHDGVAVPETYAPPPPLTTTEAWTADVSLETDFYRNPTLLGRFICNQKYGRAVSRVLARPDEARIWLVCPSRRSTSEEGDGQTTTRRWLPIHLACRALSVCYDGRQLRLINELIALLVYCHPDGAHVNVERWPPLVEALWYGADARTISVFLIARPDALSWRDRRGRSLAELNRHRHTGTAAEKEQVRRLLDRGVAFWQRARNEASLRLRLSGEDDVGTSPPNVPVTPTTAGTSGRAGAEKSLGYDDNDEESTAAVVSPLSWDQLERRAVAAEQVLAEVNERNYDLSRRVEALQTIEEVQTRKMAAELRQIDNQNAELGRKLRALERVLTKHVLSKKGDDDADEATRAQLRLALAEVSSLAALTDKSSLSGLQQSLAEPLQAIRKQSKKLRQRQGEQREQMRKIKFILEALTQPSIADDHERGADNDVNEAHEDEHDEDSSTTTLDNSGLTSRSNYSTEVKNRTAAGVGFLVDRTPATAMMMSNSATAAAVDQLELSVIFKHGASYDFARRYPNLVAAVTADPDNDLELILAWAASLETGQNLDDLETVASNYSPVRPAVAAHPKKRRDRIQRHYRDIELPALLPGDDDLSYFEDSHAGEEIDPIPVESYHEEGEAAEHLSESQASL